MSGEGALFKTQLTGPCTNQFSWNTAKAVLNLRNEGVIFETQPRGEISLRQLGIRPALLEPISSLFPQLPGFRGPFPRPYSENILSFSSFHVY